MLRLRITAGLVEQALATSPEGRWTRVANGLPEGANLEDVHFDGEVIVMSFYHPDYRGRDETTTVLVEAMNVEAKGA